MFERRLRRVLAGVALLYAIFLGRTFLLQATEAAEARVEALERRRRTLSVPPRRGSLLDAAGDRLAWDEVGYDLLAEARGLGGREWRCRDCGRTLVTFERPPDAAGPGGGAAPVPARPPSGCRCGGAFEGTGVEDPEALAPLLGEDPAGLRGRLERVRGEAWEEGLRTADGEGVAFSLRRRRVRLEDALGRRRKVLSDIPREAALEVFLRPRAYRGLAVEVEPVRRRAPGLDPATEAILGRTGTPFAEDVEALESRGYPRWQAFRLEVGRTGLEAAFEERLQGRFGRVRVERGEGVAAVSVQEDLPAEDGEDLRLTVVPALDALAHALLGGRPGAIVALRPGDGGVLAAAGRTAEGFPAAVTGFAPGSVLKALTGAAALEAGVEPGPGEVVCRGKRNRPVPCEHLHTDTSFRGAVAGSCNAYFAEAARRVGLEPLRAMARSLGVDAPSGLGLYPEGGGTEWTQERVAGRPWDRTDLANLGVGQGPVLLSPVQVGALYAAVANGGRPVRPHLVEGSGTAAAPVLAPGTVAALRGGFEEAVRSGTASGAGLARFHAAGKTGTAQTPGGQGRLHAWFAGYAPAGDPRVVVVVVLLDQERSGGQAAAPLAARFLEEWERWDSRRR